MKTNKTAPTVRLVLACLTICQFTSLSSAMAQVVDRYDDFDQSAAKSSYGPKTKPRSVRRKSTKRIVSISDEVNAASIDLNGQMGQMRKDQQVPRAQNPVAAATSSSTFTTQIKKTPESWLSSNQTLIAPVPRSGMILGNVSIQGGVTQNEHQSIESGFTYSNKINSNNFGPQLSLAYGFTDNFYLRLADSYTPGTSTADKALAGATAQVRSNTNSDGISEPTLGLGASFDLNEDSRVTAEIVGVIPVGNAKMQKTLNDIKVNGLDGGGSVGPHLVGVQNFGAVKLIGSLEYLVQFDRTTERSENNLNMTDVKNGGNLLSSTLALEVPAAFNLGLAATYGKNDSTTTTTKGGTLLAPTTTYASGVQWMSGDLYMGIETPSIRTTFIPKVSYATYLDKEIDQLKYSRYDLWTFALQALMHF